MRIKFADFWDHQGKELKISKKNFFQSADKTPNSNLILFILLGLNKRLNVLKDSTKHLKNCDFETLKSLANFALNKLEKDFKTYIDKRMALCALYCDPMGLNHIGDLSDFCTMEEVFIFSFKNLVLSPTQIFSFPHFGRGEGDSSLYPRLRP